MKKRICIANLLVSSTVLLATGAIASGSVADENAMLDRFLKSEQYAAYSAQAYDNALMPLSYYSTTKYWRYVCQTADCRVHDVVSDDGAAYGPRDPNAAGGILQTERANVANGTDIYDAACWQIAMALLGHEDLATHPDTMLKLGYDGNASNQYDKKEGVNRAVTQGNVFNYHGHQITDPSHAYFFRMVAKNFLAADPLGGDSIVSGESQGSYHPGVITWTDWKPISGENAWAFLIGPLQAAHLRFKDQGFIPYSETAVQNALNALVAFRDMQSPLGALYYAVPGSLGNTGSTPVDPNNVSVENNASALAGLHMLGEVLSHTLQNDKSLTTEQSSQLITAINQVNAMIYGGQLPSSTSHSVTYTRGMLSFFKDDAWDASSGEFIQGGDALDPIDSQHEPEWTRSATDAPKAVDVNTWTIATLGQPLIDQWFGNHAAQTAWKNVKQWGGYFSGGVLRGVGYSDKKEDQWCKAGNVISAEWTAGAINMLHTMDSTPDNRDDIQHMMMGLHGLRTDHFASAGMGAPSDYNTMFPKLTATDDNKAKAYLYANQRCMIPFGWMANPLPSTTSTAWVVMLNKAFNPFVLGGAYSTSNHFYSGPLQEEGLSVRLVDAVKDADQFAVSYKKGSDDIQSGPQSSDNTVIDAWSVPKGTTDIEFAFHKDGQWLRACQIKNPAQLSAYKQSFSGMPGHLTITAHWTNDAGTGPCSVEWVPNAAK